MYIVKEIYMSHQYTLPQADYKSEILVPNTNNPHLAVEYINSYIEKVNCENFSVDISFMNVLDACYVSTMCSTKHYIKYPAGNINWHVSSDMVNKLSKPLTLGNSHYYC